MEKTNTLFIPFFNKSNPRKTKVIARNKSIVKSFTANFEESFNNYPSVNGFTLIKNIKYEQTDSIPWFREVYYDRNLIACISSLNNIINIDGNQINYRINKNGQTIRYPFSLIINHPNGYTKNKRYNFYLKIKLYLLLKYYTTIFNIVSTSKSMLNHNFFR